MRTRSAKIVITAVAFVFCACSGVYAQPAPEPTREPIPTIHSPEFNATATIAAITNVMSDDQAARLALVTFFDHLNSGRFNEATQLYGGTYQLMIDQNPPIDPQDHATLLRNACTFNGFQCLQIKIAGIDQKPSPAKYIFTVQFQNNDGSLFVPGSDTATTPTSYFDINVIKTPQGEFRVLDMPPYTP